MPIATDPLSLVFFASFLFGLLFLVASALLGSVGHGTHGIHGGHAVHIGTHAGHTHVGTTHQGGKADVAKTSGATHNNFSLFAYANPMTISFFLLGFGFFGYVFHTNVGFALPLTLILAAIGGIIVAGLLLALLGRVFGDSEGETIQDVSDRTGLLAKVNITIQENGIGEVLYVSPGGMRKSVPARSVDGHRLERDQEVVVISYQRGVAEVDTWDHFVNHADSENSSSDAVPHEDDIAALRALLEESEQKDTQFVMRKDTQKE